MTTMAMRLGAVGMVTDGGLRDVHEVRQLGFAYFARYIVVSHGNFGVVDVGEPVTLDGQEVKTGDILHGDANGIVIVPREVLDDLPEAVQEVRTRERATMDFVNGPEFTTRRRASGGVLAKLPERLGPIPDRLDRRSNCGRSRRRGRRPRRRPAHGKVPDPPPRPRHRRSPQAPSALALRLLEDGALREVRVGQRPVSSRTTAAARRAGRPAPAARPSRRAMPGRRVRRRRLPRPGRPIVIAGFPGGRLPRNRSCRSARPAGQGSQAK